MKRWRQTEEKTASKRSRTDKNARATSFSVSQSLQDLLAKRGDFQDLTAADSYRYGLGYYRDQNLHAVFYFLLVTLQEQIVKFWQWLRQSAGVAHDRMCHAALATWKSIETENPGAQLEGAVAARFVATVGSMPAGGSDVGKTYDEAYNVAAVQAKRSEEAKAWNRQASSSSSHLDGSSERSPGDEQTAMGQQWKGFDALVYVQLDLPLAEAGLIPVLPKYLNKTLRARGGNNTWNQLSLHGRCMVHRVERRERTSLGTIA